MRKCLFPENEHNKPPSSFVKRLREIQDKPSKEFLKSVVDQNVEANFRPKASCNCPKVAGMSDSELIQDMKAWKTRQMDSVTETYERLPKPDRRTPIPSDWSNSDDRKDDQARAPIAKTIPQDPQPSTSVGTYASETLRRPNTCPKVLTFGRGKLAPLGSGTGITIGHRHGIHIDQTTPVKEPAIAVVPPSQDRIVCNNRVQTYDEPPAAVRPRHTLANWTSIRLGNDPNRPTVTEMAKCTINI